MEIRIPPWFQKIPRKLLIFILLAVVSLTACTPAPPADLPTSPEEVPRISIEELLQKMETGENILIVDNRSEGPYREGHIKGAISVSFSTISSGDWKPPRSKEIVLYCA